MKILTALIILTGAFTLQADARPDHPLENQLVTVRVTSQTWNEYRPWQKKKPQTRTFVGTVISGNRILMSADDLPDATLIQVEKYDRPPRVPARVIHCDPQVGLAVITVDEPGFFDELNPVKIAEDASGDDYFCATWMSGQLSLAACRWSKATVFDSSMPYYNYVGIYFISDLSSGGWGEPVFSGNQLIGLGISQRDDRVTVLPAEFVNAYLNAIELETYPGFAWLGINYQINKGLAQAAYTGLKGTPRGILVRSCFPGSSVDGVLEPNDILLELDGHPIDPLGDYIHPKYGTIDMTLIASDNHISGDTIDAVVLRNKEEITISIPLKAVPPSAALIPGNRLNTPPPYLVAGGFVYRELDELYLQAWGKKWKEEIPAYLRILLNMKNETSTPEQRRLIVLTDVFPDEYNLGYHDMSQNIVKTVNGCPIDSIRKMEEAFQHSQNGFHVIEFMPSYGISKVILDASTFESATQSIMEKYQIPTRIRMR